MFDVPPGKRNRLVSWAGSPKFPFAVILVVSVASCALYVWNHELWMEGLRRHVPAMDNLKQARLQSVKGYLFAVLAADEQKLALSGEAVALVEQARLSIADCRQGRSTLTGMDGIPIDDPATLADLDAYDAAMAAFGEGVKSYLSSPPGEQRGRLGLALHTQAYEVTHLAEEVDRKLDDAFRARLHGQHSVHLLSLGAWVGFLAMISWLLHRSGLARQKAQAALAHSEENLRITLHSIGDAVIATDSQGQVAAMNPVAEQLTGWEADAAKGRPLDDVFRIVNAQTRKTVESPVVKVLREGQVIGLANHTALIAKGGTERQIADSGAPIRDAGGQIVGVVLVFRDVTEQYRLEEELRQAQKMEAMGQLAGGVAHDFNNALAAILGGAQLLQRNLPPSDILSRYTNMIEQAVGRVSNLTTQLLSFSRKGKMSVVLLDLNELVRRVNNMLEHVIDKRIEIRLALSPTPVCTEGDPSQLENALLNLAVNARDAMPSGGTLEFGTRAVEVDESFSRERSLDVPEGRYGEVWVRDSGLGIAPDVVSRIFEPFFTTKGIGKGTGLGLSAVYGTVKEHGGGIEVESEPGAGTVFRLYFPYKEPGVAQTENSREELRTGQGCVLVIEDERMLQELATDLLQSLGYRVIIAEEGVSGIATYRQRHGEIDLILLDLMMPKMSGEEVFHELRAINPEAKILIASGFGMQGSPQRLLAAGALGFIRKPFRLAEMSELVSKALQP